MYVILTSKPGHYHTEPGPGLTPVEAYDYVFHGVRKARFVVAALAGETRIRVVDEGDGAAVNSVPTKFLERFDTLDRVRRALADLTAFGHLDARLVPVAAGAPDVRNETAVA